MIGCEDDCFEKCFVILLTNKKDVKAVKPKSPVSRELYEILIDKGYSEQFSDLITKNLNTDFTAGRMIGYLSHYTSLPEAEIVDEMLSILSDRNRIMQKKDMEATNARWNRIMEEGFDGRGQL